MPLAACAKAIIIMAKAVVEFQYKPKEADLFIKYTSE